MVKKLNFLRYSVVSPDLFDTNFFQESFHIKCQVVEFWLTVKQCRQNSKLYLLTWTDVFHGDPFYAYCIDFSLVYRVQDHWLCFSPSHLGKKNKNHDSSRFTIQHNRKSSLFDIKNWLHGTSDLKLTAYNDVRNEREPADMQQDCWLGCHNMGN